MKDAADDNIRRGANGRWFIFGQFLLPPDVVIEPNIRRMITSAVEQSEKIATL